MTGYARTEAQEVAERCALIEGRVHDIVDEKAVNVIGEDRRKSLPPLDTSKNILAMMVSILGRILRPSPAVSGLDPRLATLLGDASSSSSRARLAKIGHAPMPTGLLMGAEGSRYGGLIRGARYVHGVGYSAQLIDWSRAAKKPYCMTVRPCDFDVISDPNDPSRRIIWLHRRSRTVAGKRVPVTDMWDLTSLDAPAFRVLAGAVYPVDGLMPTGAKDITSEVDGLAVSYPWRYDDGRPFSPLVVYGNPSAVWDFASVASGTLLSMVYRLCLSGAFVDSGFPTANVENLRPPTSTQDGVLYSGVNRGDYRLWKKIQDVESSAHWVDMAGDKPKDLLEAILAYESDFADQLGIPLSTTNAGGAPMDHQVAAQEEAIMAFADTFRSGDAVLLRRLAAIANRAGETGQLPGWSPVSEALPGLLYREEIEEAMEEAEPKPKPTTPDTTNDSTDTQGDDENAE